MPTQSFPFFSKGLLILLLSQQQLIEHIETKREIVVSLRIMSASCLRNSAAFIIGSGLFLHLQLLELLRRIFDGQHLYLLLSEDIQLALFGSPCDLEYFPYEAELLKRRHEVYGARQAFLDHLRVNVLDCLADPRELKPNPLFVVVKTHLFSSLVIRLLKKLSKLLEDK